MTTPNTSSLKARRVRNGALDKTAREMSARRRAEGIRVLAAVHAAVPRAGRPRRSSVWRCRCVDGGGTGARKWKGGRSCPQALAELASLLAVVEGQT
jgi:hypothetical protein